MTRDIQSIISPIGRYRPVPWDQIPDLGLYMDQVVTFIARAYEPLYGAGDHGSLSPSMINNYVKSKLIPRPTGKKYSREQIALLLMIVPLKQTCTMEDIRRLDDGARQGRQEKKPASGMRGGKQTTRFHNLNERDDDLDAYSAQVMRQRLGQE